MCERNDREATMRLIEAAEQPIREWALREEQQAERIRARGIYQRPGFFQRVFQRSNHGHDQHI